MPFESTRIEPSLLSLATAIEAPAAAGLGEAAAAGLVTEDDCEVPQAVARTATLAIAHPRLHSGSLEASRPSHPRFRVGNPVYSTATRTSSCAARATEVRVRRPVLLGFHDRPFRNLSVVNVPPQCNQQLAREDCAYWIERFNAGGVACGHINNLRQVFEEPQIEHLHMVQDVVSEHHGAQRLVGQPMHLERTPSRIVRAAPRRGEHTEEILGELGFGADDLARMKSKGIF